MKEFMKAFIQASSTKRALVLRMIELCANSEAFFQACTAEIDSNHDQSCSFEHWETFINNWEATNNATGI